MTGPVVGSARVEITGDLGKFAGETEHGIHEAVSKAQGAINPSTGEAIGKKLDNAVADGIRSHAHEMTAAADSAAKHAGHEAESRMGEYGKLAGEKFSEHAKEGMSSLHGAVMGGMGALGTGELVASSLEAADQLEVANQKIEHVFGESSEQVRHWAGTMANSFGMSKTAAETAAGTYANILAPLHKSGEETAGMSEKLVTLTQDMAKFSGASPDKVQAALQRGLRGSGTALRQFGVDLSSTNIKQYALNHGMTSSVVSSGAVAAAHEKVRIATLNLTDVMGKASSTELQRSKAQAALETANLSLNKAEAGRVAPLTNAQKSEAAYALILQQTKKQQGAVGESSDTLATRKKVLMAQVENLKASFGMGLMPILSKVAGYLIRDVVPAFSTAGHWIKQNGEWLGPLVLAIGGAVAAYKAVALVTAGWSAVQKAVAAVSALFTTATEAQTAATGEAATAQEGLNTTMEMNPIGLIIAAVVALAVGLVMLWKHSETFRNIVKGAFHGVEVAFHAVGHAFAVVGDAIGAVFGFILRHWGLFLAPLTGGFSLLIQHWHAIWDAMHSAWGWAESHIFAPIGRALGAIVRWAGDAKNAAASIFDHFFDALYNAGAFVFNGISTIWNDTIGSLSFTIPDWVPGVGGDGFSMPRLPTISYRALGGELDHLTMVGERGPEMLLNGRSVLANPTTAGGNFDAFANKVAEKLGHGQRLHHADLAALGQMLMARPTVLHVNGREIARAANDGNLALGRR